jgi:hypothetical protein
MTESHDIPDWYIPDDEKIIANDAERDEIKENGELDEPRCPHCGSEYIDNTGDTYIHELVEVQPDYPLDDAKLKPGLVCVNGEQRLLNGYMDTDSRGYL